MSKHSG